MSKEKEFKKPIYWIHLLVDYGALSGVFALLMHNKVALIPSLIIGFFVLAGVDIFQHDVLGVK